MLVHPVRGRCALAFSLTVLLGALPALAQGNPAATRSAADSAMTRERFCDAAYLYRRLDEQSADATTSLKSAEAMAQGGDRGGAVAVLEAFAVRFPGHPLQGGAAKRLELLKAAIAKVGPGSSCPIPAPDCGNGLVEGAETCDDGNRVDADSCPATCAVVGAAAPVVTPPVVTPPVVTPPIVTPPVVAPPVVAPPAPVTPPPTTTTPTPTGTGPTTSPVLPEDEPVSTTDRLTETPQPTVIEPVEPPPPPPVERADDDGDDDEALEAEVPAGPGPPIAGITIASLGGLLTVGGLGATVVGVLPAISYFSGRGGQAAAVAEYEAAGSTAEERAAAGAAADARFAQVRDSTAWNTQGRFLVIGGGVALAAGVGALIGGIVMIASHGSDVEEGGAETGPPTRRSVDDEEDEEEE